MKKSQLLLLICLPFFAFADFWTQKATFPAPGRGQGVSVHLGNSGYVGLGNSGSQYLNDWWKYDRSTNTWTQLSAFPGSGRSGSFGFTSNNNVYVAGGRDAGGLLNELWLYNPSINAWLQKNNFPGSKKAQACGFVAGTNIYMGAGISDTTPTYAKDFWQYNPVGDTWTQKNNLPGKARAEAVGMACNKVGYYGLGISVGDTLLNDFWQYDTLTDMWMSLPSFAGGNRYASSRFSLFNQAYIGTGFDTVVPLHAAGDWWQFDPVSQQWTAKANVGGNVWGDMISFSIFSKGYLGIGQQNAGTYTTDFWEYTPDSALTGIQQPAETVATTTRITPNPLVTSSIYEINDDVSLHDLTLYMYDNSTRMAKKIAITNSKTIIDKGDLKPGMYIFILMQKTRIISKGKFLIA